MPALRPVRSQRLRAALRQSFLPAAAPLLAPAARQAPGCDDTSARLASTAGGAELAETAWGVQGTIPLGTRSGVTQGAGAWDRRWTRATLPRRGTRMESDDRMSLSRADRRASV